MQIPKYLLRTSSKNSKRRLHIECSPSRGGRATSDAHSKIWLPFIMALYCVLSSTKWWMISISAAAACFASCLDLRSSKLFEGSLCRFQNTSLEQLRRPQSGGTASEQKSAAYLSISYQTSMKSQPEAPEGLWNPLVRGVGSEEDRPLCRGPPVMSHGPQWESGYGSTCLHRILWANFCACNVLNKRF